MNLPVRMPLPPMEALAVSEIPEGAHWQYEPKWDGFRCLIFRDGNEAALQSKSGQPLARYFPEIVEAVGQLPEKKLVLDGEIVVPNGPGFSFDALLQRIHPAASRVQRLAAETPSLFIAFDLLVSAAGQDLALEPLEKRRPELEAFADSALFAEGERFRLSRATRLLSEAKKWLGKTGTMLDGVIAKRTDLPYQSGLRTGMQKVKNYRSADCVIGGFRYATAGKQVGSLLLGLYDDEGKLNHVGFTSGIRDVDRPDLTRRMEAIAGPPGFTGTKPGGPSRWSTARSAEWIPVKPVSVVEVSFDHVSEGRFRHGTKLVRWRPDKAPEQCRMEQLAQPVANLARLLV